MELNDITGEIVDAAMKVHSKVGPGLLESAYHAFLRHELLRRGMRVRSEVRLPVEYDGVRIECAYRLDLLVEESVPVELKTVGLLLPLHSAQLRSYLKLGNFKVGLLINFHVVRLKDGIERMVNKF